MNTMCKVSIVIPVYNTAPYLRQCLDSIRNQDLDDIQILCINDGSTDDSSKILQEYARKDSRFILLEGNHQGVGNARNIGLKKAYGEYIFFVDSDDYLLKHSLKQLYETAHNTKADILIFGARVTNIWIADDWILDCINTRNKIYDKFIPEILYQENGSIPIVWNKLFRRDFLAETKVTFNTLLTIAEDQLFDFCVFPMGRRFVFTKTKGYCYRICRKGSAMERANQQIEWKENQHKEFASQVYTNWHEHAYWGTKKVLLENYLDCFLNNDSQSTNTSSNNKFIANLNYLRKKGIKRFIIKITRKLLQSSGKY